MAKTKEPEKMAKAQTLAFHVGTLCEWLDAGNDMPEPLASLIDNRITTSTGLHVQRDGAWEVIPLDAELHVINGALFVVGVASEGDEPVGETSESPEANG